MKGVLTALLIAFSLQVLAAEELYRFENEAVRERYRRFTHELRCPKCQNQNLADSDAPIAADLRNELRRLLNEGRNDDEIVDFMVSRYGDYVLYRPPLERRTWLLWGAPALLLGVGIVVLWRVKSRAARAAHEGTVSRPLDDAERRRLRELIGDDTAP
jgi:cytochrome c-type biogenesis protein CcmH